MKFKSNQSEEQNKEQKGMSKELHSAFVDMIQFEIDKLQWVTSAKFYSIDNGLSSYEKFFEYLIKKCAETKDCFIGYLRLNMEEVPDFREAALINDFTNTVEPFKQLAQLEDVYEEKLNNLITIANNDKNWKVFSYLLKKIDCVDHICCRALAAVENKADPNALIPSCEQHFLEKL